MAKKSTKKTVVRNKKSRTTIKKTVPAGKTIIYQTRYIIIGLSVLLLLLIGALNAKATDKTLVLGTSVLLASENSESDSTSGSSKEEEEEEEIVNTSDNENNEDEDEDEDEDETEIASTETSDSTLVDCVGPDGKHFQTTLKKCAKLNSDWGHKKFNFIVLKQEKAALQLEKKRLKQAEQEKRRQEITAKKAERVFQKIETDDGKIEIKKENGKVVIKTKSPQGEIQLKGEEALDRINKTIENLEMEVEAEDGDKVIIKQNGVKTKTHFPVSVNPTTGIMTVTTPAGIKEVTILPKSAVERVLQTGILDNIEKESPTASSASSESPEVATLTDLNNEPVFEIKGFSQKKLLGILPVLFAKKVFVSAENGRIVKTDTTFFNSLLDIISF